MTQTTERREIGRLGFYAGAVAIAVVAWQVQRYVAGQHILEPLVESLSQLEEKQLQAFLDMNRLLTTLGTTLLGALGIVLASGSKGQSKSHLRWPAIASGAFAVVSVFFGYIAYEGILYMLRNQFFDLDSPVILWPHRAHFYTLLLSVFFFGDFVIHDLTNYDQRARPQSISGV